MPAIRQDIEVDPAAVAAFVAIGWTAQQWESLVRAYTTGAGWAPGSPNVAEWLSNPPKKFVTPITTDQVQDMFARYGKQTAQVLTLVTAGASERFAVAFLGYSHQSVADAADGWKHACTLGLTDAAAVFATIGWTPSQWDELYKFLTASPQQAPGAAVLASWLRHPPAVFVTPISPATVKDVFARHSKRAGQVLTALAAGASERFVVIFLGPPWAKAITPTAVTGWRYACSVGLTEPHATGWAATGYLRAPAETQEQTTTLIRAWTDRFGPDAFLYVLAGIRLDEAIAMLDAGTSPVEEQLRVMVALNGVVLPAGI